MNQPKSISTLTDKPMSGNTSESISDSKQPFKLRYSSLVATIIIALVIGMTFSGCGGPDVKIVDGVASFEERLHPYSRAEIFAFTMTLPTA